MVGGGGGGHQSWRLTSSSGPKPQAAHPRGVHAAARRLTRMRNVSTRELCEVVHVLPLERSLLLSYQFHFPFLFSAASSSPSVSAPDTALSSPSSSSSSSPSGSDSSSSSGNPKPIAVLTPKAARVRWRASDHSRDVRIRGARQEGRGGGRGADGWMGFGLKGAAALLVSHPTDTTV